MPEGVTTGERTGKPTVTPLVLDLDGTLTQSDVTIESLIKLFRQNPLQGLKALGMGLGGRAAMKAYIAERVSVDISTLPMNTALVEYARQQYASGRPVYLVTASHQSYADAVGKEFEFFSDVHGSTTCNLKGLQKASFLETRFPDGFTYAGDNAADAPVWKRASSGIYAGRSQAGQRAFERSGTACEETFPMAKDSGADWMRALRLHQWAKNVLLFVALFLGHVFDEPAAWIKTALGFFALGLIASATYVVNDLLDLEADRQHSTKCYRPFASGSLKVVEGILGGLALLVGGIAISWFLPALFQTLLVIYLVTTLAYSFWLKRYALVDVFLLGGLFTIRIAMGAALVGVALSPWLLVFSMFFFTGLSMAKRHAELGRSRNDPMTLLPGRGYMPSDAGLVLAIGVACAASSVLILTLYLVEGAFPSGAYPRPEWLWGAPVLVALWLSRLWLVASRKELHDDPVVFAIKDGGSRAMGVILAVFFGLAVFGF